MIRETEHLGPDTGAHWAKLAAMLLWKLVGEKPVTITKAEMDQMNEATAPEGVSIAVINTKDTVTLYLKRTPEGASDVGE